MSTGKTVLALALSSERLSPGQVYDVASTVIAQKIAQIPGVGQVEAGGSSLPAVRVWSERLKAMEAGQRALTIRAMEATLAAVEGRN